MVSISNPMITLVSIVWMVTASVGKISAQANAEDFKPSGKIWGYSFGDFYLKSGGDTATWASRAEYSGVPKDVYAFSFRRIYLGYDYTISPKFSTVALLESSDLVLTARGERSVFFKSLYLKWKNIYKGADLLIGQMPTLAYSLIAEKVWNYRSIEKTILDMRGVRSSSDMGVALYGVIDSLANYGYNLMIANGNGPRPEELTNTGKHKLYAADVWGYWFQKKVVIDLYGEYTTGPDEKTATNVKLFAAYQTNPFTIGLEVYKGIFRNAKSDGTDVTPLGYSIFARGQIVKEKLAAFARYDSYNPDDSYRAQDALTSYNASNMFRHYDEQFSVVGLDWSPHKNVPIMPNVWINSYDPKTDTEILVPRESDIGPRLTFYFIFR